MHGIVNLHESPGRAGGLLSRIHLKITGSVQFPVSVPTPEPFQVGGLN